MRNVLVNSRFGIQLDKVLRHLIPNMCQVHKHTHSFQEAKLLQPAGSVACTKQPSLSLLYKHYLLIITHMNICMFESSQLCAAFQAAMTMCYSYCTSLAEGIKTPEKEQQGWFLMQNLVREAKLWPKRSCLQLYSSWGFCTGRGNSFLHSNCQKKPLNNTNEPRTVPEELYSRQPSSLSMCSCTTDKQHDCDENEHALSANLPWVKKQNLGGTNMSAQAGRMEHDASCVLTDTWRWTGTGEWTWRPSRQWWH